MDYMVPHVELMSINKLAQPITAGCRSLEQHIQMHISL